MRLRRDYLSMYLLFLEQNNFALEIQCWVSEKNVSEFYVNQLISLSFPPPWVSPPLDFPDFLTRGGDSTFLRMARRRRKNLHISVNCDRKSSPKWSITTVFPIMTSHRILKNFRLRRATLKNVKKCVFGRLRRPKKWQKNWVFLKNVEFPPPLDFPFFLTRGGGNSTISVDRLMRAVVHVWTTG